jgi:hypothetical protein
VLDDTLIPVDPARLVTPVLVYVTVLFSALVVVDIPLPLANVNVAFALGASSVVWPLTAIKRHSFCKIFGELFVTVIIPVPPTGSRMIPLPATSLVTPVLVNVTVPVAVLTLIPVPARALVTPVLVIVTAPVAALTLIPVPAIFEVTPELAKVIVSVAGFVVIAIPVPTKFTVPVKSFATTSP